MTGQGEGLTPLLFLCLLMLTSMHGIPIMSDLEKNHSQFFTIDLEIEPATCIKCPKCRNTDFVKQATVLPWQLIRNTNKKDNTHLWVGRVECAGKKCDGFVDVLLHPDRPNGGGYLFIKKHNPISSLVPLFKDFPRVKTK